MSIKSCSTTCDEPRGFAHSPAATRHAHCCLMSSVADLFSRSLNLKRQKQEIDLASCTRSAIDKLCAFSLTKPKCSRSASICCILAAPRTQRRVDSPPQALTQSTLRATALQPQDKRLKNSKNRSNRSTKRSTGRQHLASSWIRCSKVAASTVSS